VLYGRRWLPHPFGLEAFDTLFVLIGQSNALSANNNPALSAFWKTNAGKAWWWAGGTPYWCGQGTASASGSTGNAFVDNDVITTDAARTNPLISGMQHVLDCGGRAALLHVAEGSTNLYSDWAAPPNSGASNLFGVLDHEGSAAVADATFPLSRNYRTVFVWWQGEADAASQLHADNYQSRLTDFINGVEGLAWVLNPSWIIVRLHPGGPETYGDTVRAAEDAVVAAKPNTKIFRPDPWRLNPDGFHFPATCYTGIGVGVARLASPSLPTQLYAMEGMTSADYYASASSGESNKSPAGGDTFFWWCVAQYVAGGSVTLEHKMYERWATAADGVRCILGAGANGSITTTAVSGGVNVTHTASLPSVPVAGRVDFFGGRISAGAMQVHARGQWIAGTTAIGTVTPAILNRTPRLLRMTSGTAEVRVMCVGLAAQVPSDAALMQLGAQCKLGNYALCDAAGLSVMGPNDQIWVAEDALSTWPSRNPVAAIDGGSLLTVQGAPVLAKALAPAFMW
jgi:hypothetical protein